MNNLYILIGIIIFLGIIVRVFNFGNGRGKKAKYLYHRHNFFMTKAEHEFFDALVLSVGSDYFIFAQVHLPTLLDHKTRGQNWRAALAHINRKSVDFVLCDKKDLSPKLAIELDDQSHERADRQERDKEVERILSEAGVPLLRIENQGSFNPDELATKIREMALA